MSVRALVAAGFGALLLLATVGAGAMAAIWQGDLADSGAVLPGTTVAGVDLDGRTLEQAREDITAAGTELLERSITISHGLKEWQTSAADLGGTVDVDAAMSSATAATREAGIHRVVAARWFGARPGDAIDLPVTLDDAAVDALLDEVVDAVDRLPRDAGIELAADGAVVVPAQVGYTVDRLASRRVLTEALRGHGGAQVAPTVSELPFDVATEEVEPLLPTVAAAAEEVLDRAVTITHGEREWRITAVEIGASLDLQPLVTALLSEQRAAAAAAADGAAVAATTVSGIPADAPPLTLEVGPAVDAFVAELALDVDVPVRDAAIDHSTGWVELIRDQRGERVDRDAAVRAVADALVKGADRVTLPVEVTEPEVTADAFSHVLLVRLDERRLYLYEDGEITREWPVAIGAPSYNTPTGVFTVGLKRYLPSWHNPAPDGWGADMPEVIGPGPNNPLGLRALNWLRDGAATLIRFHGTSATSSIGHAASKGCIRLRNADVVELYDLVPTGATIVSTWG